MRIEKGRLFVLPAMNGSHYGLYLYGDSNVYRRNTARANTFDFTDLGVNNTAHGDNYMPNPM